MDALDTMMESRGAASAVRERTGHGGYVAPIAAGLLIAAAGLLPWTLLAQANARVRPDLPWAALATLTYLTALLLWLNGAGPPRRTASRRRERLRLWPPGAMDEADAPGGGAVALAAVLGLLYLLWIVVGRLSPIPDLSAFPTTSYRWSMFVMGGLTAGVVEEAAFRGYMQTGLERHDRTNALWITSLVFAVAHVTQGIGAVLLLGPGLFVASMLYGTLARRTGTILPGIAIHTSGDLAYVYFGVLRGDGSLLFAS
ncbi:MAG TPA: CPBP family intramembrane glutamic endopeptidase [Vicinamibacterales bacterium]|nr:CPBP family intramembrane glutamic endopeptidase [Vicinamibacterales bacterium]